MNKFFDKKIEEELGTAVALQLAAAAADLRSKMDAMAAIRVAQGLPTIEEEVAATTKAIRHLVAIGQLRREDYPEFFDDE